MDNTPAQNHTKARGERLDSWKEIAAYLKRDIRTAQRWEKQEALPVHRHLHDERGTAYAYSGEIDEWLQNRSRRDSDAAAPNDSALTGRPAEVAPASAQRSSRPWPVLIAIAVVAGAGVLAIWVLSRPEPVPPPISSLSVVFAPSERFRDWGPDIAFSPDGSTLVYAGLDGRLSVRRTDQLSGRALEGTEGSWGPFFSPDGRWIGFNHRGHLKKIAVEGGAPVPLGVPVGFVGAADWGSDDYIVYAATTPEGTTGLYACGPPVEQRSSSPLPTKAPMRSGSLPSPSRMARSSWPHSRGPRRQARASRSLPCRWPRARAVCSWTMRGTRCTSAMGFSSIGGTTRCLPSGWTPTGSKSSDRMYLPGTRWESVSACDRGRLPRARWSTGRA